MDQRTGENQVNTLVYSMGDQADDILIPFELNEEQEIEYDTVKSKFENHFVIKKNVIFGRAKFNSRSQGDGKLVDNFITELYCLTEHCQFGALKEELIRDHIVVGLQNECLSEKLQLSSNLTLEKAINLVRQSESVKKQQSILHGAKKSDAAKVDRIAKGKFDFSKKRSNNK